MSNSNWNVILRVHRQKGEQPPYFQDFSMEVDPGEYVLEAVERIWAFEDRSLVFRHACHHSVCGACGMRLNGVEKLTCITPFRDVTRAGGVLLVEPLRNFPVISDLSVNMAGFYSLLESVNSRPILPLADAPVTQGLSANNGKKGAKSDIVRLIDCIECGMCISACPVATTTPEYVGPAVLAAAQQSSPADLPKILDLADSAGGVWRCHSAYECTAVCPSNVEPAWRIMELRKQVVKHRVAGLFGRSALPSGNA